MLKEILCGYHDPKVKADQVWVCLVFRKVAVAKPSATAALCDDLMRFHNAIDPLRVRTNWIIWLFQQRPNSPNPLLWSVISSVIFHSWDSWNSQITSTPKGGLYDYFNRVPPVLRINLPFISSTIFHSILRRQPSDQTCLERLHTATSSGHRMCCLRDTPREGAHPA